MKDFGEDVIRISRGRENVVNGFWKIGKGG